jgi:hypothetical protein
MKIIEALKKIKHLDRKVEKAQGRVKQWCTYTVRTDKPQEGQEPLYNAEDVRRMIQAITDWKVEKARLRHQLHITNLQTEVEFRGKVWNVDQLLLHQALVLPAMLETQKLLSRQNRGFGYHDKVTETVMQYDPKEREKRVDALEYEAEELNALLDQISIGTDVIE